MIDQTVEYDNLNYITLLFNTAITSDVIHCYRDIWGGALFNSLAIYRAVPMHQALT